MRCWGMNGECAYSAALGASSHMIVEDAFGSDIQADFTRFANSNS